MTSAPVRQGAVDRAAADLMAGEPVVVIDAAGADLMLAAQAASEETVGFLVRYTSGVLRAAMPPSWLARLGLGSAAPTSRAGSLPVDARAGVTSGASAADRARTARVLADPASRRGDLSFPGHVFPDATADGGALRKRGRAEAATDLLAAARMNPVALLAEIVDDRGPLMRAPHLTAFAETHGLAVVSVADLTGYRLRTERLIERAAQARIPTAHGIFRAVGYRDLCHGGEHLVMVHGDPGAAAQVPVHVHPECLIGDVFGAAHCGCRARLGTALATIADIGAGAIVYLRPAGGLRLARNDPARQAVVAQILADLGIHRATLFDDDPHDDPQP